MLPLVDRRVATLAFLAQRFISTAALVLPTPPTRLVFAPPRPDVVRKTVLCGTKAALLSDGAKGLLPLGLPFLRWKYLVELASDEGTGTGASRDWLFTAADGQPSTIVAAVLPEACSRHSSPVRPHSVTALLKDSAKKSADVILVLEDPTHAGGTACAVGRAFPMYTAKSQRRGSARPAGDDVAVGEASGGQATVHVSFATCNGPLGDAEGDYDAYAAAAEGVRRAARLVDLPPDVLTTTAFVGEAQEAANRLTAKGRPVEVSILSGEELRDGGYGFLWGVGKAAVEPPALVVLSALPAAGEPDASETVVKPSSCTHAARHPRPALALTPTLALALA